MISAGLLSLQCFTNNSASQMELVQYIPAQIIQKQVDRMLVSNFVGGESTMNKFKTFALTICFCFPLIGPGIITAQPQDRDDRAHRYYDEEHKDYHQWDAAEERYWRNYWASQHRRYVDWDRANDEQRRAYWRWRHEHEHEHEHDHDHEHDRDDRH